MIITIYIATTPSSQSRPRSSTTFLRCWRRACAPATSPDLQLAIHLRGINDGWNSRRKAAENRRQNREYQIILHRARPGRRNHIPPAGNGAPGARGLQVPAALHADHCGVRVIRPALCTKHSLPPRRNQRSLLQWPAVLHATPHRAAGVHPDHDRTRPSKTLALQSGSLPPDRPLPGISRSPPLRFRCATL